VSQDFLDGMAAEHAAIHGELGEFSEPMRIRYPARASAPTVDVDSFCIFNELYQTADPETGVAVMSNNSAALVFVPSIEALTGESFVDKCVPGNVVVTIRGTDYVVSSPHSDGTGCHVLVLKKRGPL